jgi:acyl carrier protein
LTEIETAIRDFIVDELERVPADQLNIDTPLLDDDILDSMGVYELVVFLEERYSIEIVDEEIVPENFGSLTSLAKLVEVKR